MSMFSDSPACPPEPPCAAAAPPFRPSPLSVPSPAAAAAAAAPAPLMGPSMPPVAEGGDLFGGFAVFRDEEFATVNISAAAAAGGGGAPQPEEEEDVLEDSPELRDFRAQMGVSAGGGEARGLRVLEDDRNSRSAAEAGLLAADDTEAMEEDDKENAMGENASAPGASVPALERALQPLTLGRRASETEEEMMEEAGLAAEAEAALRAGGPAADQHGNLLRDDFRVYGDDEELDAAEGGPGGASASGVSSGEAESRATEAGARGGASELSSCAGGNNDYAPVEEAMEEEGGYVEPFGRATYEAMLAGCDTPLGELEGVFLHGEGGPAPQGVVDTVAACRRRQRASGVQTVPLKLGESTYLLKGAVGKGRAGAVVFEAYPLMDEEDLESADDEGNVFALKVQTPAWAWEYVVQHQLQQRLSAEARPMFMHAHRMHLFSDYTMLLTDFGEHGSLAEALGKYSATGQQMDEVVAMFYTIELLSMVEHMHAAGVVHLALAPDNLMLRNGGQEWEEWAPWKPGSWQEKGLTLVDFGAALDLTAFPPGTVFFGDTGVEPASRCAEMKEEKAWTFQPDYTALCGVVHALLFGREPEVVRGEDGRWAIQAQFKRQWQSGLWQRLFDELLNAPAGAEAYPLEGLRGAFEEYLVDRPEKMRELKLLMMKQTIMLFSM
eukprot:1178134-Prorocentrum_minimum.AAC.1